MVNLWCKSFDFWNCIEENRNQASNLFLNFDHNKNFENVLKISLQYAGYVFQMSEWYILWIKS